MTLLFDLCTSAPKVRVREYVSRYIFFVFCCPICSNSFLVFCGYHERKTSKRKNVQLRELHEVLYVPDLSYNLLSVSKAAKAGKVVKFSETGCEILDSNKKVMAVATRVESLYHLNCQAHNEQTNAAVNKSKETKEDTWHR